MRSSIVTQVSFTITHQSFSHLLLFHKWFVFSLGSPVFVIRLTFLSPLLPLNHFHDSRGFIWMCFSYSDAPIVCHDSCNDSQVLFHDSLVLKICLMTLSSFTKALLSFAMALMFWSSISSRVSWLSCLLLWLSYLLSWLSNPFPWLSRLKVGFMASWPSSHAPWLSHLLSWLSGIFLMKDMMVGWNGMALWIDVCQYMQHGSFNGSLSMLCNICITKALTHRFLYWILMRCRKLLSSAEWSNSLRPKWNWLATLRTPAWAFSTLSVLIGMRTVMSANKVWISIWNLSFHH